MADIKRTLAKLHMSFKEAERAARKSLPSRQRTTLEKRLFGTKRENMVSSYTGFADKVKLAWKRLVPGPQHDVDMALWHLRNLRASFGDNASAHLGEGHLRICATTVDVIMEQIQPGASAVQHPAQRRVEPCVA